MVSDENESDSDEVVRLPSARQLIQELEVAESGECKKKIKEMIELRREFRFCVGTDVLNWRGTLYLSKHCVDENYEELHETISELEGDPSLISSDRREDRTELRKEFARRFDNFVMSTKSREEHTKRIISNLDDLSDERVELSKEYRSKVSDCLSFEQGLFFTRLRNVLAHEWPVNPSSKFIFEDGESRLFFVFDKDDLLSREPFQATDDPTTTKQKHNRQARDFLKFLDQKSIYARK